MPESRKTYPVPAWLAVLLALIPMAPTLAVAQEPSADARARSTEQHMTDDERFALLISLSGATRFTGGVRDQRYPADVPSTAGYSPGVPRLGIPALLSSDASMGVTNPGFRPDDKGATAMPALVLSGATFNPQLARAGGGVLGREARIRGFNIMLAGGINLARDLRNGRTYEYYSEDPWLSARFGPRLYQGSPGVSFSADDFSEVVYERAGTRQTALVPAEIAITGCFLLLQHHGVITIPITGYPGAAPTFRVMMHPDGGGLGLDRLERAIDDTFERTAGLLQRPGAVKTLLLGEESRAEEMPLWWQGRAR